MKKEYLNKMVKNQCQHLTEIKHNELLKVIQKIEDLFDGTLGTWKIDLVGLKIKIR